LEGAVEVYEGKRGVEPMKEVYGFTDAEIVAALGRFFFLRGMVLKLEMK